jgi:hypothetical protein
MDLDVLRIAPVWRGSAPADGKRLAVDRQHFSSAWERDCDTISNST